jgi:hypothetical protein
MVEGTLPSGSGGTGSATGNLGTPSGIVLTNATGLPLTTGVTGLLPVGNGGTGTNTFAANAILMGNVTGAIRTATAGTHYAPATSGANLLASNGAGGFTQVGLSGNLSYSAGTLTSTGLSNTQSYVWSALQTFNQALFVAPKESAVINTTAPGGAATILNTVTSLILYTTANPTANWTLNVTGVSTLLTQNGQTLTVVHLVTNGSTGYVQSALQIDNVSQTAAAIKWLNVSTPTSGNPSGIDAYTLTIIKISTGYTIIGSLARYG